MMAQPIPNIEMPPFHWERPKIQTHIREEITDRIVYISAVDSISETVFNYFNYF
jgi:hypothetical protein